VNTPTTTKIKVANAPCSWGVLEFELAGQAAGYERVLDEMKQSGYTGTELGDWGFMPTDPQKLRDELAKREIELLAAFVPVDLANENAHAEGVERAVKTARLLQAVNPQALIVLADDNGKHPVRTKEAGRIQPEHWLNASQSTLRSGPWSCAERMTSPGR
jgi:inosose dehydratase